MSQNQREAWERVQVMLQKRKAGFGGFPGGGGRGGGFGLAGTLILLGVGGWVASNSLFNGMLVLEFPSCILVADIGFKWMVVTVLSSIRV